MKDWTETDGVPNGEVYVSMSSTSGKSVIAYLEIIVKLRNEKELLLRENVLLKQTLENIEKIINR